MTNHNHGRRRPQQVRRTRQAVFTLVPSTSKFSRILTSTSNLTPKLVGIKNSPDHSLMSSKEEADAVTNVKTASPRRTLYPRPSLVTSQWRGTHNGSSLCSSARTANQLWSIFGAASPPPPQTPPKMKKCPLHLCSSRKIFSAFAVRRRTFGLSRAESMNLCIFTSHH